MLVRALNHLRRAARRFLITGRVRAAPGPIIEGFFGGKECFFVQVGANDGVGGDPLHALVKANPQWCGIFIEPLDEVFERLIVNYPREDRFAFENAAISDSNGEQWLHYVPRETILEEALDHTIQRLGSFNRDFLLRELTVRRLSLGLTKDPDAYISRKLVRCETLASVLERHRVSHIDILIIDVEGYDYHVIRQIDFNRYRPAIILYEHVHLGTDANAARSLLLQNGYHLINCGVLDTMAVDASLSPLFNYCRRVIGRGRLQSIEAPI